MPPLVLVLSLLVYAYSTRVLRYLGLSRYDLRRRLVICRTNIGREPRCRLPDLLSFLCFWKAFSIRDIYAR